MIEQIKWISVNDELPDQDMNVLMFMPSWKEVSEGYWDGGWIWNGEIPVSATVTHWAEMPKGPQ